MTEPMTLARFEQLVAAYGAQPKRWPHPERAAAHALLERDPQATQLLAEADTLDAILFVHEAPAPSPDLHARIVASAPRRRTARNLRLWWSGVALALAGGGGALAGSAATAALDPTIASIPLYEHDYLPAFEAAPEEKTP
ncbi:hypothetical protein [Sphingomonas sp.]|uniref:hypothetical protein n=1 Tax=Sphingomonas sp. TaxID=28214 RepID=UPI003B3ACFAE